MKELGSEAVRQAEDNQPTKPNPNPIVRTGRPGQNKRLFRVLRKSIHVSLLTARTPICWLNFLEKDKDTDKDVDADRERTVRLVVS